MPRYASFSQQQQGSERLQESSHQPILTLYEINPVSKLDVLVGPCLKQALKMTAYFSSRSLFHQCALNSVCLGPGENGGWLTNVHQYVVNKLCPGFRFSLWLHAHRPPTVHSQPDSELFTFFLK